MNGIHKSEALKKYFNQVTSADNVFNRPGRFQLDDILDWYKDPTTDYAHSCMPELKGKRVLEIGCGIGVHLVYLARQGSEVTGIDIASERIRIAKNLMNDAGLASKVRLIVSDIFEAELPAGYFDYIYGHDILMYMDRDYRRLIAEMKRLLKPEGRIIFIEGLRAHPLASVYRRYCAPKTWLEFTDYFDYSDLEIFRNNFTDIRHREFYLTGFLAYFWKIYMPSKRIFRCTERVLFLFDTMLLEAFPFLRRFCWRIVFSGEKT